MIKIPSSEITPEHVYLNRRQFMKVAAFSAGALALAACGVESGSTGGSSQAGSSTQAPTDSIPAHCRRDDRRAGRCR